MSFLLAIRGNVPNSASDLITRNFLTTLVAFSRLHQDLCSGDLPVSLSKQGIKTLYEFLILPISVLQRHFPQLVQPKIKRRRVQIMTLPLCNYLNFPINYSALGFSVLLSTLNYLCFSIKTVEEISPSHSYQTSSKHMTLHIIQMT